MSQQCGNTNDKPVYVFDRESVQAVDRAAIDEFKIPGVVLMENAARGLADAACSMIDAMPADRRGVLIICGSGNNGGDGFALARILHNREVHVTVASLKEPRPGTEAATNYTICRSMKIREIPIDALNTLGRGGSIGLIVDAIFGTGLDRSITGKPAEIIQWINTAELPVLAVDVPSGLDCNTGEPLGIAVRATKTVTFVGPKIGFFTATGREYVGEVTVTDIGVPIELVKRFGTLPTTPQWRTGAAR